MWPITQVDTARLPLEEPLDFLCAEDLGEEQAKLVEQGLQTFCRCAREYVARRGAETLTGAATWPPSYVCFISRIMGSAPVAENNSYETINYITYWESDIHITAGKPRQCWLCDFTKKKLPRFLPRS
jgi:hypothetical protein